jgi:hypothetical protein
VFASQASPKDGRSRNPGNPLLSFRSTPETRPRTERPPSPGTRPGTYDGSSLEVSSPSAFSRLRAAAYCGRVCLTQPPAPPGFLNLLTHSSALGLPALFHAGPAHGVAPFRALLPSGSRTPSPAPMPSCRCSRARAVPACGHMPSRLPRTPRQW